MCDIKDKNLSKQNFPSDLTEFGIINGFNFNNMKNIDF